MEAAEPPASSGYKVLSKRAKIIAASCLGLCAAVVAISVGVTQGSSSSSDPSGSVRGLGKNQNKAVAPDAAVTDAPTAAPTGAPSQQGIVPPAPGAGEKPAPDTANPNAIQPAYGPKRKLRWSDEFEGTKLNTTIWTYTLGDGCPENCNFGNAELQSYQKDNVVVKDGKLTLEGRFEKVGNSQITSGKIHTRADTGFDILYGRIEAKITLPKGRGAWPSMFMLPSGFEYGAWPGSGEIDILESFNTQFAEGETIMGTIHYGYPAGAGDKLKGNNPDGVGAKGQNGCVFKSGYSYAGKAHVFAAEWSPRSIKYFVDGLEYCEFTQWWAGGDLKSKTAPFDKPFELILNLAVGGNLPGAMAVSDIPEAAMPMKMEIEYVRVFELTAEELAYENPFPGPVLPVSAADKVPSAYNVDPTTLKRVAWNIASGGMRIDAELFDYGGQGVGYFDKDPLVNNGNAALRKNEGVEVSEDNVWIAPDAWKFVDSAGAYITLDKDEWTAYTIDLPTPYETLYFQIRHSTLTGSGFKIIVDSTNCKDPTLDGGAVVLEVPETIAAYIPGPGLTPPKSYGFLPKCWHTERWLTLPIKTPGEHVLVFCSVSDDFNLQYIDVFPFLPDDPLKVGPGCGF